MERVPSIRKRITDSELAFAPFIEAMKGVPTLEAHRDHVLKELAKINLSDSSTADDVRRAAITLRLKFRDKQGGINDDSFRALHFALRQTGDAVNMTEYLEFMDGASFEEIEKERPNPSTSLSTAFTYSFFR